MRLIRTVLLVLAALMAAPAAAPALTATPSLAAQAPAASAQAAPAAAPAADAAQTAGGGLPRYTPPRTLRAYAHVFVAFAAAWVLLFGYLVFLSRKFRRVEEQVAALARS